jgi:hypothetical protein
MGETTVNNLSNELLAQMFAQESGDPFLTLVTISHPDDPQVFRFVTNSENIISRGEEYISFPMRITMPKDDGETVRSAQLELDNVSLLLMPILRTMTTPFDCKIEMVLASDLDNVEIEITDLKLRGISYDSRVIRATLSLDDFLSTEMTSEKYDPVNYPGLF